MTSSAYAVTGASTGRKANGANNPIGSLEPVRAGGVGSRGLENRCEAEGLARAGEREEGRLVPLMPGRDDPLLLVYLSERALCQTLTNLHGETAHPSGSVPGKSAKY